jgi:hypothetical protein
MAMGECSLAYCLLTVHLANAHDTPALGQIFQPRREHDWLFQVTGGERGLRSPLSGGNLVVRLLVWVRE